MLIPMLLWLAGCGYTTQRPFSDQIKTVHVEMFQTHEFRKDLEFRLTEALVKRIEMDTPYRIVERKRADSLLTGQVLEVHQNSLGQDFQTGLPRETGATFVVSYRWQDLRTGKILSERQRLVYTTAYIRPLGETFHDGSMRGLEGLAQVLVESMESAW